MPFSESIESIHTNKHRSKPLVTVAMPVYNGEVYLKEAVDSILNQTYENIDFLIIDDGSTDSSVDLIKSYKDPRIRLFQNDKNRGVGYTRNRAIDLAIGDYLAWMDCDDLSLPQKIELQVAYMERNKDIGVSGTSYLLFFEGTVFYESVAEENHEKIRANQVFRPATIFMPTSIIRRQILKNEKIRFDEKLIMAEDYDFFQRLCERCKSSNLTEILFHYRDNPNSLTQSFENQTHERYLLKKKIYRRILKGLSLEATEQDLLSHENCTNSIMFANFQTLLDCANHLRMIELANRESKTYNSAVMKQVLKEQFFFISKKGGGLGLKTLIFYIGKSFKWNYFNGMSSLLKVTVRSIIRYKGYSLKSRLYKKKYRKTK